MTTTVAIAPAIEQDGTVVVLDAWDVHTDIVALRNLAVKTFLHLGERLHTFKQMRGWTVQGHPTFESYLADPDVDVSRSLAFKLMRIHRIFVELLQCPPDILLQAGYNKLEKVAPHVHGGNVDRLIHMAAANSRSDVIKKLREEFGDDATPPLPTDYRTRYIYARRRLRERYWAHWEFERERVRWR